MANTIVCTNCGVTIEIDKALEGQIEARVLAAEQHKHSEELAKVRTEATERGRKQLEGEKQLLQQRAKDEIELVKKRLELEANSAQKKAASEQESLIRTLKDDADSAKLDSKKLREELTDMMRLLREEKQARANAELEAQKKLAAGEDKIREDAVKSADEKYHLKILEQEKKLADTQKALEDAQRKATQGSQQNQGEVLELDLENRLREEFPFDEITEVKKGQRGADMKQIVKNQSGVNCGLLLWETKNGKWQPAWIPKFKQDIREANASVGVIVSQETPSEIGDLKHLEGNVWVVTPRLATHLAAALRLTILQVYTANQMNANKDSSIESLYQYMVGPEFRHRIEAIVENYTVLQSEIERERRVSVQRWARQEKAIHAVMDNTYGMYGDLQGITNRALPSIKNLELDTGELEEDDTAQPTLL